MTAPRTRWLMASLLVPLVAAGCGGTDGSGPAPASPAPESENATADRSRSEAAEIEALYRARVDSARMRFSEADVRFMAGMIHHHAQAIRMSRLAPENGASASVRTLAARIINAQQDEIVTMQRWLRDRDQPVVEVDLETGHVMTAGHAHMPGMLTPEQLRELESARGADFDRLFLTYMIQHHQGAITMVHELFSIDGAGQEEEAFRLATDIQADQTTEVARMQRLLDALSSD